MHTITCGHRWRTILLASDGYRTCWIVTGRLRDDACPRGYIRPGGARSLSANPEAASRLDSRFSTPGCRPEGKRDRASCRSSAGGRRLCRAHKSWVTGRARPHGRRDFCNRGEPIAAWAGARTAEAIVPAIQPNDRDPGPHPPGGYRHRGMEMSPTQSRARGGGTTKGIVRRPIDGRLWVRGEVTAVTGGRLLFGQEQRRRRASSSGMWWRCRDPARCCERVGSLFTRPLPADRNLAGLASSQVDPGLCECATGRPEHR
jgi:hypothetical protein